MAKTSQSLSPRLGGWLMLGVLGLLLLVTFLWKGTGTLEREAPWGLSPSHSPLSTLEWWTIASANVTWISAGVLALSVGLGFAVAMLVAYGPMAFETLLTRLADLASALPSLIVLGLWRVGEVVPSAWSFVVILGLLQSLEFARLMSEESRRLESLGFVTTARSLGASRRRLLMVHVLPWLRPRLAVQLALTTAAVTGLEAALTFVGLGLEDTPTWGGLLGMAARSHDVSALHWLFALAWSAGIVAAVYTLARRVTLHDGNSTRVD